MTMMMVTMTVTIKLMTVTIKLMAVTIKLMMVMIEQSYCQVRMREVQGAICIASIVQLVIGYTGARIKILVIEVHHIDGCAMYIQVFASNI